MAGAELTGVGMLHSDCLGGLVYLDAIGDSTDDPPDDPTWKALQAKLPPSGPPPDLHEDRSSFAAFRASLQCRHGIAIPEGDLRQGFETAADGSVGAARSPGWVSRAIGTGRPPRDYSKIKVPVLAISDAVDFDLSHLKPEQPQPRNDEDRAAAHRLRQGDAGRLRSLERQPEARRAQRQGRRHARRDTLHLDDTRGRRAARDPRLRGRAAAAALSAPFHRAGARRQRW